MKIALIGYGRMGHMIEAIAIRRGHQIVSVIDADNQEDFRSKAFSSADVAVEFTNPSAAYGNICKAFDQGVKVVTGSTGWQKEHNDDIQRLCRQGNTLFWSSNFSLGVYLFDCVNEYLAKLMNGYPSYDVRIEETHHVHKLDAPSGTAITLADTVLRNIDRKAVWKKGSLTTPEGEQGFPGGKEENVLLVDSIRRGEVPGRHSVIYDSECDSITITHDAHNRKGFALGAVLAAEYTHNHEGLLTMDDLFHDIKR